MDLKHGKYLGVDYGDKRTGLAESDIAGQLASGITTVRCGGMRNTAVRVAREAIERGCKKIIVGLPRNMDGSEGERAQTCREIAGLIGEQSGVEVVLRDERNTTVSAYTALNAGDVRGKKRKNVVDAVAATIILQDYLDYLKNTNE